MQHDEGISANQTPTKGMKSVIHLLDEYIEVTRVRTCYKIPPLWQSRAMAATLTARLDFCQS